MPTMKEALDWRGQTMVSSDGKIGKIEEIYVDADTDQPEWALVNTGLFGSASSFVPIADATVQDGDVLVPFDKATVKDAPNLEPDGQLSQDDEAALYRHYHMDYTEARSDSGLPEGGATTDTGTGERSERFRHDESRDETVGDDISGPETDDAMTRSEEEVRVGTTRRESGRMRLRKYIVEEEVQQTVPVRREEVRLEREPITDANAGDAMAGADLSEEEHEVVLHEEEAVVDKRVVPKERVSLGKDVTESEETVSDTVRKEQVEMLDADGEPREGSGRR